MFASQCCVCRCIHNTAFQVILILMEDDLGGRQQIIKKYRRGYLLENNVAK